MMELRVMREIVGTLVAVTLCVVALVLLEKVGAFLTSVTKYVDVRAAQTWNHKCDKEVKK